MAENPKTMSYGEKESARKASAERLIVGYNEARAQALLPQNTKRCPSVMPTRE